MTTKNDRLIRYNRGIQDGRTSAARLGHNPIHNNWKKDKSSKVIHHSVDYVEGYKEGYERASGIRPFCLSEI